MKYGVNIRWSNPGSTKYLMTSEGSLDLNSAFDRASELLEQNKECFAEIVEEQSNAVIATIN